MINKDCGKVYLSIGSNMGDKKKYIRDALCAIGQFSEMNAVSKFYRTKPYGNMDQPDFINFAVEISTHLEPEDLLGRLQAVEASLGRVRSIKWGPRPIDLDILFYDKRIIQTQQLTVPHPDLQNRLFVLRPMMDIAPDLVHPVLGESIRNLFALAIDRNL